MSRVYHASGDPENRHYFFWTSGRPTSDVVGLWPHELGRAVDWVTVMMGSSVMLNVAIVVAGIAVGILVMLIVSTAREARKAALRAARKEQRFASLVELAEQLSAEPDNETSAEALLAHLAELPSNVQSIEIVSHLISLDGPESAVAQVVGRSDRVKAWVTIHPQTPVDHQIAALELLAELDEATALPQVLVAVSHQHPEVRRAALRTMSSLAPVQALSLYFREIPSEGPWVLERLAAAVRQPGVVDSFVSRYGNQELAAMIGLLAEVLVDGDERRALAAIDTLGAIDHPDSAAALLRTARAAEPMLAIAATDVLDALTIHRPTAARLPVATH